MVEAIPAGCEICISYIRTFCRFVKIFFIQINSFPFFVQFEIFTTKFWKLTSICYIFANGKCAWVLNFAQDQTWPDHFCSRSFRQQILQEKFGFSCSCIKCRWDSPRWCVHQTIFYPADASSTYTYPSILGYFCKSYLTRVFNHPLDALSPIMLTFHFNMHHMFILVDIFKRVFFLLQNVFHGLIGCTTKW